MKIRGAHLVGLAAVRVLGASITVAALLATATPVARAAEPPPAVLDAPDRIAFNAALDALVMGNLAQARTLFDRLAREGRSTELRLAAALIVDRLAALEVRRSAGLVPRLPAPDAALPAPSAEPVPAPEPPVRSSLDPPFAPDPGARTPVIVTTTALGLALWGWALPSSFGLEPGRHTRAFLGLYMLTAAGSFIGPYFYTRHHPPTAAGMNLVFYGGTRGAEWGLMLSNLLFGKAGGDWDDHPRAFGASLLLGSLGGVVGGALLSERYELSAGDVRTIAALADFGLLGGFGLGHALGLDELRNAATPIHLDGAPAFDKRARSMSALGIAGTLAGMVGGRFLAGRRHNTWGDGEVMRGAGVLGAFTALTVGTLVQDDNGSRVNAALAIAGGGLGFFAGDWFVRDADFTPGQAILVDGALLAGALAGMGVTYLASDADRAEPYLVAATLGAAGGGGFVAYTFRRDRAGIARTSVAPRISLMPRFDPHAAGRVNGLSLVGGF